MRIVKRLNVCAAPVLVALMLLASGSAFADSLAGAPQPQLGDRAPGLPTTDVRTGKPCVRGANEIWVVEFFATWCPACRRGLIDSLAVVEDLTSDQPAKRIRLVVVDVGEPQQHVVDWFATNGLPQQANLVVDPDRKAFHAWGANRLPTTFVVDEGGIIRHINNGHGSGFRQRLTHWLRKRLAQP